jgi:predicted phage terminase large subunit-like protein
MPKRNPEDYEEIAWRARLADYAQRMSGGKWIPYKYLVYVADLIQDAIDEGGARILVSTAPRHGKSLLLSKWLPIWYLDLYPDRHVISTGYSNDFAANFGRGVRDEFQNNPNTWTRVRKDKDAASEWLTTHGGGMRTAGVGGKVTGFGGDINLIDDPIKSFEEAMSPAYRKRLIEWFTGTLYSRAEPGASFVGIATRWHEDDLFGWLLREHGNEWTHIRLPAIAEADDVIGREEGAALCPDRYDEEALLRIKAAVGSHVWAGLYQQRPTPIEGGHVKEAWLRFWTQLPASLTDHLMSWDLTFKKSGTSWVVGQVWARNGADAFLLDQFRERCSLTETLAAIERMSEKWPNVTTKLIEDAANGPAVIDALRGRVGGIIPVRPKGSKLERFLTTTPLIESGNVWFPQPASHPWVNDFIDELLSFPSSVNDDQVDAMSQGLERYSRRSINIRLDGSSWGVGNWKPNEWRDNA